MDATDNDSKYTAWSPFAVGITLSHAADIQDARKLRIETDEGVVGDVVGVSSHPSGVLTLHVRTLNKREWWERAAALSYPAFAAAQALMFLAGVAVGVGAANGWFGEPF